MRVHVLLGIGLTISLFSALTRTESIGSWCVGDDSPDRTIAEGLELPVLKNVAEKAPLLPEKWSAVALLHPFKDDQLVVAEFVCDTTVPALRATLYGIDNGLVDLLITRNGSFELEGGGPAPKMTRLKTKGWAPPGRAWIQGEGPQKALCIGKSPLGFVDVEWWKAPSAPESATSGTNWYWILSESRMPWRSIFAAESNSPPVIGSFAMTYFLKFEAQNKTTLDDLAASAQKVGADPEGESLDIMSRLRNGQEDKRKEVYRKNRIRELFPELILEKREERERHRLPVWPDEFGMTTFMTPVRFDLNPLPTEVLYNWKATSQRTRMFATGGKGDDALLLGDKGYHIHWSGKEQSCAEVLPGPPRPDWMARDKAKIRAVIGPHQKLSPGRKTFVIMAPLVDSRVFWTWYMAGTERDEAPQDGARPIVFMETNAPPEVGTGLAIADYYSFSSRVRAPKEVFAKPAVCDKKNVAGLSSLAIFSHGLTDRKQASLAPSSLPRACFTCHLGAN